MDPLVSVIVPMFNAGETVREAIQSALTAGERVEVIVVDDGSQDQGGRIVENVAAADPRVRLIRQPNRGTSAAKNRGLEAARSRWVRFLDADDWHLPGSTDRLIAAAEEAGADAARGTFEVRDEQGRGLGRESSSQAGPDGWIGAAELRRANQMGTGAHAIRRAAIGQMRFDESMSLCEDWDMWLRLAQPGGGGLRWKVLGSHHEPVSAYRVRAASLSKNFAGMFAAARGIIEKTGPDPAAISGQALAFGTMEALVKESSNLPNATGPWRGPAMAEAAIWGVMMGLGVRPEERGERQSSWLNRLAAWWNECVRNNRTTEGEIRTAWDELARQLVAPDAAAAEVVRHARRSGSEGLIVVGYGQNGRRVLAAAKRAGVRAQVRDDRVDRGEIDVPDGIPSDRMGDIVVNGWSPVVTPWEDDALAARFPGAVRWRETVEELARAEAENLRRCLGLGG